MNFEETIAYIQGNLFGIVGGTILVLTIVGITMSFLKRAVFYADFNDLALTAGMFALPALVMVAGSMLAPGEYIIYIAGAVFAGLLLKVIVTTWKSNEGSFWKTPLLIVGKVAMSFIFIAYLYQAFTRKTRSGRGQGWFVVAIVTPLMIALVSEHRGLFAISSTGRIRAATGKARK